MHGIQEQLSAGLVRNRPRTVQEFIKEATTIERAVQERAANTTERKQNNDPSAAAGITSTDNKVLREFVRSVARGELKNVD